MVKQSSNKNKDTKNLTNNKITKKYNYTMKTGRPPLYKTPEEMENKISEYFKPENLPTIKKYTALGQEVLVPCPTVTGLTLFLGFCDRHSFYAYEENKPEFSNIIKKARTFIEKHYEELLQNGNTTGAIFALKNFGWKDKTELDQNIKATIDIKDFRNNLIKEIEKQEQE